MKVDVGRNLKLRGIGGRGKFVKNQMRDAGGMRSTRQAMVLFVLRYEPETT